MTMDDIVLHIRNLIENETRSCSMDFGCITPQYVYRIWGENVAIDKIATGLTELESNMQRVRQS